jgi:hypothetical protein
MRKNSRHEDRNTKERATVFPTYVRTRVKRTGMRKNVQPCSPRTSAHAVSNPGRAKVKLRVHAHDSLDNISELLDHSTSMTMVHRNGQLFLSIAYHPSTKFEGLSTYRATPTLGWLKKNCYHQVVQRYSCQSNPRLSTMDEGNFIPAAKVTRRCTIQPEKS